MLPAPLACLLLDPWALDPSKAVLDEVRLVVEGDDPESAVKPDWEDEPEWADEPEWDDEPEWADEAEWADEPEWADEAEWADEPERAEIADEP